MGITRQSVIEMAKDLGISIRVGDFPGEALLEADEAFVTSTAGGVMPLASVDGTALLGGEPGTLSHRIRAEYWKRRERGWLGTPLADLLR
jgi:branched-subunit amino acid aminotransferase/4-amino-4-deoxychorismate lyase